MKRERTLYSQSFLFIASDQYLIWVNIMITESIITIMTIEYDEMSRRSYHGYVNKKII